VIIVSTPPASSNSTQYLGYIAGAVIVIVIVAILIYALSRRSGRALPKHSQEEPSSGPPPEGIDLTPTQQPPVQQIVIKEVAKKTCKYCGALMDTTAQVCPRCGAPNT
jgi:ribosomal protein L40E